METYGAKFACVSSVVMRAERAASAGRENCAVVVPWYLARTRNLPVLRAAEVLLLSLERWH